MDLNDIVSALSAYGGSAVADVITKIGDVHDVRQFMNAEGTLIFERMFKYKTEDGRTFARRG